MSQKEQELIQENTANPYKFRGSEIVGALVHLSYMGGGINLDRYPKQFFADMLGVHRTSIHRALVAARSSRLLAEEIRKQLAGYKKVKTGRPKGSTGRGYKKNRAKRRMRSGFPSQPDQ